jgi:hypothetical protein
MRNWKVPKLADLETTKRASSSERAEAEFDLVSRAWMGVLAAKLHAIATMISLRETWFNIFITHLSAGILWRQPALVGFSSAATERSGLATFEGLGE